MPPAARVAIDTAGGVPTCKIVGPGWPKVMVCGGPIACVGDAVAGAYPPGAYAGAISVGYPKVTAGGRPVAFVGSPVTGVLTPPPPAPPVPTPLVVTTFPTPPC
jgi:uncharacterized Zn-binding protein involved in type VI secretion